MSKRRKGEPWSADHELKRLGPMPRDRSARFEWQEKRQRILNRKRRFDVIAMADTGPDSGGRYSPSPYLTQHGHVVEVAPQALRPGKDSSFPKRIATQRMIDRYRVQRLINLRQWKAANRLWREWRATGLDPRIVSTYDFLGVSGGDSADSRMVGRSEAVLDFREAMGKVGPVGIGVLMHVVIFDGSASEWAQLKRCNAKVSGPIGLMFLREALDCLAAHYGY